MSRISSALFWRGCYRLARPGWVTVPGLLTNALIVYAAGRIIIPRTRSHRGESARETLFFIYSHCHRDGDQPDLAGRPKARSCADAYAEDLEANLRQRADEAVRSAEAMRETLNSVREQARLLDLAYDAILLIRPDRRDSLLESWSGADVRLDPEEALGKRSARSAANRLCDSTGGDPAAGGRHRVTGKAS